MNVVTRLPEGAELPCELACGPLVSVWGNWEGCGRPKIADPVDRLHAAHRSWVLAGQQWSMAQGASRNAWIGLLSQDVLDAVSVAGRERAEQLARRRMVPQS
ncbi:MAG TPA: hypothetical protein VF317_07915 [Dermatophilaceae bacterium]